MTTHPADPDAAAPPFLALLADLQAQFLATIPDVEPSTRVPWCGPWRVEDLVVHLARIHHWAASQARRRQETPLGRGPFVLTELYASCAAELRHTLAVLGPDAPSWTLLGDGRASFWHRRQTHETLVHLWDLRTAGGLELGIDPAVWADGVDEVVTVLQPRQERLGRMDALPAPVALRATDSHREWLLGGRTVPAVQVAGPASVLALLLWGRTRPDDDRLHVTGDRSALDDALSRRLTP